MKLTSSAHYSLLFLSSILGLSSAASSSHLNDELTCVAHSPTSGLYYDLNPISISPPQTKNGKKVSQEDRDESWPAKGHDYPANFTLNVCAPVIENFTDVVGVPASRWQNISAFYEQHGKIYSLGEQRSDPFFRGRKLVLNYTNGSPCPDEFNGAASNASVRTMSTLMSFMCDRDAPANQATASFVGTMDSCSFYFEIRSSAACGGLAVDPNSGGMGPAGVFGVIMLIAVAAYFIGGCAYQRTVMHQRGWRQCPNFSLWAGMLDFIKDMFIISFSSIGNCLRLRRSPSNGGYTRPGSDDRGGFIGAIGGRGGRGSGGRGDVDAENRLIDQLDEEWDD
ncbi:Vacuolar sorting receptor (Mrl1) [Penicillium tannophilum]|nr:Vacuolar sorting receptor (Mrl1) [Penicillium tannophilum]